MGHCVASGPFLGEERLFPFLPFTIVTASKSKAAEAAIQHLKNWYPRREQHKLSKDIVLPVLAQRMR